MVFYFFGKTFFFSQKFYILLFLELISIVIYFNKLFYNYSFCICIMNYLLRYMFKAYLILNFNICLLSVYIYAYWNRNINLILALFAPFSLLNPIQWIAGLLTLVFFIKSQCLLLLKLSMVIFGDCSSLHPPFRLSILEVLILQNKQFTFSFSSWIILSFFGNERVCRTSCIYS